MLSKIPSESVAEEPKKFEKAVLIEDNSRKRAVKGFVNYGGIIKQLKEEIDADREDHGKKPLKDKDDGGNDNNDGNNNNDFGNNGKDNGTVKEEKRSTVDPDCGWFHKGEHKEVFAYSVETACDKHGWILGYTVNRGNLHDSRTFKGLYDKLNTEQIKKIIADAAYKTPAIAKLLINNGIDPIFPYKRPMTKDGFFKKYEYVYDEYYDCYICPNNKILKYSTTNRDGYREYKSCPSDCEACPYREKCTESANRVKVVTRHIWEEYIEKCEDLRHTDGNKELYEQRKETIERLFGTAKECHGFRYTNMIGKARAEMKVGLTFACMNLKKLARILWRKGGNKGISPFSLLFFSLHERTCVFLSLFSPEYAKTTLGA